MSTLPKNFEKFSIPVGILAIKIRSILAYEDPFDRLQMHYVWAIFNIIHKRIKEKET